MIQIRLHKKNYAVIREDEIESEYVPRVGEILELYDYCQAFDPSLEITDFFIYEVKHKTIGKKLIPVIDCRQWLEGDRRTELKNLGWL